MGSKIFRQIIGIFLRTDPAPFFANLFLYHYKNKWIKKKKKNDITQARRIANAFMFIDDLTKLNDGAEFKQSFKQVFPLELLLEEQNISNNEGSLLDLFVRMENN